MLQFQFVLQNAHFALSLLAAFVFFAMFWLYLDAWLAKKGFKEGCKWFGALLLSFSFVVHAIALEQTAFVKPILPHEINLLLVSVLRVFGYLSLMLGIVMDRLEPRPSLNGLLIFPKGLSFASAGMLFYPILSSMVGFLYLRRATVGLENHIKPVAAAFFILSLSELTSLAQLFRATDNILILQLVAPFEKLWLLEHAFLLGAIAILGRWVFGYLLKRIQTQLVMILSTSTLLIFLITTVSFTFLLLRDFERTTLSHLETDVSVLSYAIESKKESSLSDAEVVVQNNTVKSAIVDNDRKTLREIASSTLLAKKQSILTIVSDRGEVLMRGEDPEKIGDSLTDDPLVKNALLGKVVTSVVTRDRALAPELSVRSAAPIRSENKIIGVAIVGSVVDNAFLDGIKAATKLESSVYAGNIRSATTIISPDGKSRWVGIKEETEAVKRKVLDEAKIYTGGVNILNTPYFAAYAPLLNVDNNPVGMLFVGKEQTSVLQAASRSIELTFIVAVTLIVFSMIPAFLIAKYITYQVK